MSTEDHSDEPFLQAPADDAALEALNSIESWPSLRGHSYKQNEISVVSPGSEVNTFRKLLSSVQEELAQYPGMAQQAFRKYAESGDPRRTVKWFIYRIPEMLFRTDQSGYIPIEAAFASGNGPAARVMLDIAKHAGTLQRLLAYRNQLYGHSLIMLAVKLNSRECEDILRKLIEFDPAGLHRICDNEGRNVLHRCTEFDYCESFRMILTILKRFPSVHKDRIATEAKAALEVADNREKTPIHYISSSGNIAMLTDLDIFLTQMQIVLNFDACHQSSSAFTPLMLAVQKGQFEVCKWLLENGSVDVNYKQHSTCLTALHFAVRAGNPELISLLMEHNADPGFCDSECDLLCCYKTPLVMAETEDVPNKLACVKSLRTSDI